MRQIIPSLVRIIGTLHDWMHVFKHWMNSYAKYVGISPDTLKSGNNKPLCL